MQKHLLDLQHSNLICSSRRRQNKIKVWFSLDKPKTYAALKRCPIDDYYCVPLLLSLGSTKEKEQWLVRIGDLNLVQRAISLCLINPF